MKVLIACETSGVVRNAFRSLGHDAWSVDILPPTEPSIHHIQGDALGVLNSGWDMIIAHPPCTYLCSSGMHWTTRGLRDTALTDAALLFVVSLMNAPVQRIAIENPVGIISTRIRKPDQIIQPWQFGEDASKRTCLWLKNLPPLQPTKYIPGRTVRSGNGQLLQRWGNQLDSGQNRLPPSFHRWKLRSATYPGIAQAMALQWSYSETV